MAIGYHKLNSSAARSKRNESRSGTTLIHDTAKLMDIKTGSAVCHFKFGEGVVTKGCMLGGNLLVKFDCGEKKLVSTFVVVRNET